MKAPKNTARTRSKVEGKSFGRSIDIAKKRSKISARLLSRFERRIVAQRLLLQACSKSIGYHNRRRESEHEPSHERIGDCCTRYFEPLRDDSDYAGSKKNCRVHFNERVSVLEIPSHRSYSKDIRMSIWSGKREIEINTQRNRREFAAEGNDATMVIEESGFVMLRGELVHPATYIRECQQKQTKASQMILTS